MLSILLLADANDDANQWLRENPLVSAGIAAAIGVAALYFGITGLQSGSTSDKYGRQLTGGMATALSIIRIVAGIGALGFALYLAVFGA